MKTLKISLPQGFTVGHGRSDMSPEVPVMMGGGWNATEVRDPLYATCTAVSDEENVVLLSNMDGKVNIMDVIALNKSLLAGVKISEQAQKNADVDQDGTPTSADSLVILKYTIKLETKLPV